MSADQAVADINDYDLYRDMALRTASSVGRAATLWASSGGKASGVKLVYSTHPSWPALPSVSGSNCGSLDIAVLDSSFNPPSKAHYALLTSRAILAEKSGTPPHERSYDAHLLLFSTLNADKGTGKAGDAGLSQRVEMMTLLAKQLERNSPTANVAIGLVDKPLIFAKSTLTWELLSSIPTRCRPRLHWVVGFDTLYRVFQLKYYASLEDFGQQCRQFFQEERTTLVCARRDESSFPALFGDAQEAESTTSRARREEDRLLASENVKPWVESGSVAMLDIDSDQAALSSTRIRSVLRDQGKSKEQKRDELSGMVPPLLVDYLLESGVYADQPQQQQ